MDTWRIDYPHLLGSRILPSLTSNSSGATLLKENEQSPRYDVAAALGFRKIYRQLGIPDPK